MKLPLSLFRLIGLGVALVLLGGCLARGEDSTLFQTSAAREANEETPHEITSFSVGNHDFQIFSDYQIAPGDQLDVLFSIRTWELESDFKLHIGDQIHIKFPNDPHLNETQRIRPDGNVTLPYIGDHLVARKSPDEIRVELEKRYKTILRNPDVYVVVEEYLSQIRELKVDLKTSARGLSRLVTVRPDGYTTFPMLGDMRVAGRTVPEVAEEMNKKYNKISPSLYVDLFLESHAGAQIYVMGEVNNAGAHVIRKPVTVIEALALAGGGSTNAVLDNVMVARKHQGRMITTSVNVLKALRMDKDSKFFYLQPDDIVFVPKTDISVFAQFMTQLRQTFWFNGWALGLGQNLSNEGLIRTKYPQLQRQ
ncbi:polysaccharide biosynthesis/export family protein [Magnetofaba australis]|nr:polysaccharide biosynthesis/export family protein [Magnetofaba australis]